MFTLLPQQQKNALYKQYRTRLVTVLCFFISCLFVVNIGLLFPSLVSIYFEKKSLMDDSNSLQTQIKRLNDKGILTTLATIQSTLSAVSLDTTDLSHIIQNILEKLPQGISLKGMNYIHGKDAPSSLSIQGVSATRDDLIKFSKSLQSDPTFIKVELPISNLAKQSDVAFSLTLLGKF